MNTIPDSHLIMTCSEHKPWPGVRMINWLGHLSRRFGLRVDLAPELIIKDAQRQSGLKAALDETAQGALTRLAKAFDYEAGLTTFGRGFVRIILTRHVTTHLLKRYYLKKFPEILTTELSPPLIVVGMPRTGTTLLYNLLAQDGDSRPLLGWESLYPVPPCHSFGRQDPRRRYSRWTEKVVGWLAPSLRQIHPFSAEGPEECTWLMANTLVSPAFAMFGYIPSYMDWLCGLGDEVWSRVYRDYQEQLLILQHQRQGTRWLLKSPVHFLSLGPLLKTIPNTRLVFIDRKPSDVVASTCSLFSVFRSISTGHSDPGMLGKEILDHLVFGTLRMGKVLAENPDRLIRVDFRNLVTDKLGTVRKIYDHFGFNLTTDTEARMTSWIANDRHVPAHHYSLDQFGLSDQVVQDRFSKIGRVSNAGVQLIDPIN